MRVNLGGIATNIGIHFFDMLLWIFGGVQSQQIHIHEHDRAAGFLQLEKADIRWFLSINSDTLPEGTDGSSHRSLLIDDQAFDFSKGFEDLHTRSYEAILSGVGFSLADAAPAVALCHEIRESQPLGVKGDFHPFAKLPLSAHPFSRKND